jgi:hypothetical protein
MQHSITNGRFENVQKFETSFIRTDRDASFMGSFVAHIYTHTCVYTHTHSHTQAHTYNYTCNSYTYIYTYRLIHTLTHNRCHEIPRADSGQLPDLVNYSKTAICESGQVIRRDPPTPKSDRMPRIPILKIAVLGEKTNSGNYPESGNLIAPNITHNTRRLWARSWLMLLLVDVTCVDVCVWLCVCFILALHLFTTAGTLSCSD